MQQPRLGTRKLHHILSGRPDTALHIGRDRLFTVLRQAGLPVRPARAYHKTTHSHHRFYRHPNLLKAGPEQVIISGPEQVWVADITWLPVRTGTAYVSLVTDAFSRKIVGYHVHESLHTEHVVKALQMVLKHRRGRMPLIYHSDRGIQYCSSLYQSVHEKHGLICSMTDGYDCYQNALAEMVNGILKNELLITRPEDVTQAERMVAESVESYARTSHQVNVLRTAVLEPEPANYVIYCAPIIPDIARINTTLDTVIKHAQVKRALAYVYTHWKHSLAPLT